MSNSACVRAWLQVRIDCSEYMEKHAVSRMIGAPPGYVGYDEVRAEGGGGGTLFSSTSLLS